MVKKLLISALFSSTIYSNCIETDKYNLAISYLDQATHYNNVYIDVIKDVIIINAQLESSTISVKVPYSLCKNPLTLFAGKLKGDITIEPIYPPKKAKTVTNKPHIFSILFYIYLSGFITIYTLIYIFFFYMGLKGMPDKEAFKAIGIHGILLNLVWPFYLPWLIVNMFKLFNSKKKKKRS